MQMRDAWQAGPGRVTLQMRDAWQAGTGRVTCR
jgi:hypothetical protein